MQPLSQITPTPVPPAELLDRAEQVIDTWNTLGPIMGLLFVVGLAFFAILFVVWNNRNSTSTVVSVLSNANAQKDREIAELKAQRAVEHQMHIESLGAIHANGQRSNDLLDASTQIQRQQTDLLVAINKRGQERDNREDMMAADLNRLVTEGSIPLQKGLATVQEIALKVTNIDSRTADWTTILESITPLLAELNTLRLEAKKHKTGPIPQVEVPTMPDNPIGATS